MRREFIQAALAEPTRTAISVSIVGGDMNVVAEREAEIAKPSLDFSVAAVSSLPCDVCFGARPFSDPCQIGEPLRFAAGIVASWG